MQHSAIYAGAVAHKRFRPRPHRLRYRVFSLLIDIDELPQLGRRLRLFAYNGFGLFSFHDRDHGDGGGGLRLWAERHMAAAGVSRTAAPSASSAIHESLAMYSIR